MTFLTKKNNKEQGITLLIVLLVGTILLFTSLAVGQYALRMVNAIRARSEATQTLYTAEQTFECVKYWLRQDYRHFSTLGGGFSTAECNGTTYDFTVNPHTDDAGGTPTYTVSGIVGVATFRIPFDHANPSGGGVTVEVERSDVNKTQFDGVIRVYSQSDKETGSQTSERFQEYDYEVLNGADIMFVVDRSGSITGDRSIRAKGADDWNKMLDAVNDSIRLLNRKVPAPRVGLVSFGTDPTDTGRYVAGEGLLPDVLLTNDINDLIDDVNGNNNPGDDTTFEEDVPKMTSTAETATNLSLGISIAASELMRKYYPYDGVGVAPSGQFETIVANDDDDFTGLPSQPASALTGDRPDNLYPDVMVVITDGAPNGIMTHISGTWEHAAVVTATNEFYAPVASALYDIGSAKIFRTRVPAGENQVVDDINATNGVPATKAYIYCDDTESEDPTDVLTGANDTLNFPPRMAMCNATRIVEQLDENSANKITFIAIYVGTDLTLPEVEWLQDNFVSPDSKGQPLFAAVEKYEDVQAALLDQFEKLGLVQSR